MAKINKKLIALRDAQASKLNTKEERFQGTFKFIGINGTGTYKYELIDIDKETDKLFNLETSVVEQVHLYLQEHDSKSLFYISQNPRKDKNGAIEMFEGKPVFKLMLDNPVSNMITSLYNEGITAYDLTETAALKREFITNNPQIANILMFKNTFGRNNAIKRPGLSVEDLKSELASK